MRHRRACASPPPAATSTPSRVRWITPPSEFRPAPQVPIQYQPAEPMKNPHRHVLRQLVRRIHRRRHRPDLDGGAGCSSAAPEARAARMSDNFDRDYYQRFYFDPRTAVVSRAEMSARAGSSPRTPITSGLPVRRILDAGCGIGLLRRRSSARIPEAVYTGLEYSEYLCERYGWHAEARSPTAPRIRSTSWSATTFCSTSTTAPRRAPSANLARLTPRRAVSVRAHRASDWRENCDRTRTDPRRASCATRPGMAAPAPYFRPSGVGFWIRRGARSPPGKWKPSAV